jgi:hypothetical protein
MKVNLWFSRESGDVQAYIVQDSNHTRPFPSVGYEDEHIRYDPKDGELYLSRVKPGETLVEARSDTDVQIVRQTWV